MVSNLARKGLRTMATRKANTAAPAVSTETLARGEIAQIIGSIKEAQGVVKAAEGQVDIARQASAANRFDVCVSLSTIALNNNWDDKAVVAAVNFGIEQNYG